VLTLACLRLGVLPVMALPAHRRHERSYRAEHAEAVAVAVPGAVGGWRPLSRTLTERDRRSWQCRPARSTVDLPDSPLVHPGC